MAAHTNTMDAAEIWRRKSDDELLAAGARLDDYLPDGQEIIRAEIARRGLTPDAPPTDREPDRAPAPLTRVDGNPLMTLWTGGYSLPMSYWFFGCVGRAAWTAILLLLVSIANPGWPRVITALLVLVASFVYQVLVLVGIWRSAGRYRGPQAWAVLARATVAAGAAASVMQIVAGLLGLGSTR